MTFFHLTIHGASDCNYCNSPSPNSFLKFNTSTITSPLSGEAPRVIEEAEAHVAHADRQRDEAEARRRIVLESYDELNKYLAAIESRAADAHAGFQCILRDAGGHLVLTPIPNQIQHDHSPYSANPSITVEPPPRPYHRSHHRYTSSSPPTAPICQHILHALLDSDDDSKISASMASTPAPSKLT